MKVAVPVTNGYVSGPGEGLEVHVYEIEGNIIKFLEKYANPASKAITAKGIYMIRSILERNVNAIIVTEIGQHGFKMLSGKVTVYLAPQIRVEDALSKLIKNELQMIDKPIHEHHFHTQ
ncbi:MAG: NifB/NifX family molybdenum-iron cluster-binding protein [Thermoprotei archaeon]